MVNLRRRMILELDTLTEKKSIILLSALDLDAIWKGLQ